MTGATAEPLFPTRDRRILLWVCVASVCWRWVVAMRTPLPAVDAVEDLWVARLLAAGDPGALAEVWLRPWWSLLLAPAVAIGHDPFEAAQVLGCVFGGVAFVPLACAAERLRKGAGVAAALLSFSIPWPTLAAAGASSAGLRMLLGGVVVLLVVRRRILWAAVCAAIVVADARLAALAIALWLLIALGIGVVLARLSMRLRDLLLALAVAPMFLFTWNSVEPVNALVEQSLGMLVGERLEPGQLLATDLPRVAYYAGREPGGGSGELVERVASGSADVVVCTRAAEKTLALDGFAPLPLPQDLEDMARAHGVAIYARR